MNMRTPSSVIRIAGLLPTTFGDVRKVMGGAMNYLKSNPHHDVLWFQSEYPPAEHLRNWNVDGILGHFTRVHPAGDYLDLGVPMVNVSSLPQETPVVNLSTDNRAVGRLAADHLIEKGLGEFAYLGLTARRFSDDREKGFAQGLEGGAYRRLVLPETMWEWPELLEEWLDSLPRPCGVFCAGDNEARLFLSVCRARDLRIPEDMVVLGANNEEDLCLACNPPLSSVPNQGANIGFTAMECLDRMIASPISPRSENIVFPPFPVVQRGSTDILFSVDDAVLSESLTFIRTHISEGIGVQQVLNWVGVSRRTLENRFNKHLGRSPLEEIHRVRLELVRERLRDSEDSLTAIADTCGFNTINHLCGFFKKRTGETPGEFRDRIRSHS